MRCSSAYRSACEQGDKFSHGAYLVSDVEPVRDFDKSRPGTPVQAVDKEAEREPGGDDPT